MSQKDGRRKADAAKVGHQLSSNGSSRRNEAPASRDNGAMNTDGATTTASVFLATPAEESTPLHVLLTTTVTAASVKGSTGVTPGASNTLDHIAVTPVMSGKCGESCQGAHNDTTATVMRHGEDGGHEISRTQHPVGEQGNAEPTVVVVTDLQDGLNNTNNSSKGQPQALADDMNGHALSQESYGAPLNTLTPLEQALQTGLPGNLLAHFGHNNGTWSGTYNNNNNHNNVNNTSHTVTSASGSGERSITQSATCERSSQLALANAAWGLSPSATSPFLPDGPVRDPKTVAVPTLAYCASTRDTTTSAGPPPTSAPHPPRLRNDCGITDTTTSRTASHKRRQESSWVERRRYSYVSSLESTQNTQSALPRINASQSMAYFRYFHLSLRTVVLCSIIGTIALVGALSVWPLVYISSRSSDRVVSVFGIALASSIQRLMKANMNMVTVIVRGIALHPETGLLTANKMSWGNNNMHSAMRNMCNAVWLDQFSPSLLYLSISSPVSGFGAYCSAQYGGLLVGKYTDRDKGPTRRHIIDVTSFEYDETAREFTTVVPMTEWDYTIDFGWPHNGWYQVACPWYGNHTSLQNMPGCSDEYTPAASHSHPTLPPQHYSYYPHSHSGSQRGASSLSSSSSYSTLPRRPHLSPVDASEEGRWCVTQAAKASVLTYVYPFLDQNRNLAVITAGLQRTHLHDLLTDKVIQAKNMGTSIVVDLNSGVLLFESKSPSDLIMQDNWNYSDCNVSYVTPTVDNMQDPLMRAAIASLGGLSTFDRNIDRSVQWSTSFSFDGSDAEAFAFRLFNEEDEPFLNLVLIYAVQNREYAVNINSTRLAVILFALFVLVLVVQVDYVMVNLFIRPLRRLAAGLYCAAQMRDGAAHIPHTVSIITEMATMQYHFDIMNTQLMRLKAFLPHGVLDGGVLNFSDSEHDNNDDDDEESSAIGLKAESRGDVTLSQRRNSHSSRYSRLEADGVVVARGQTGSQASLAPSGLSSVGNFFAAAAALSTRLTPAVRRGESGGAAAPLCGPPRAQSTAVRFNDVDGGVTERHVEPHRVAEANSEMPEHNLFLNERVLQNKVNKFKRRYCSIVMFSFYMLFTTGLRSVEACVADFMECVIPSVLRFGGVIEIQRPEIIVVSFGAHSRLVMHQIRAAKCALDVMHHINNDTPLSRHVGCILDVGEYLVGTCGAAQRFARVSFGVHLPVHLELIKLIKSLRAQILLTRQMASSMDDSMLAMPVDCIVYTMDTRPHILYELRACTKCLPAGVAERPLRDVIRGVRRAFNYMLHGDYRTALKTLMPHEKNDHQAARLASVCRVLQARGEVRPYVRSIGRIKLQEEDLLLHPTTTVPYGNTTNSCKSLSLTTNGATGPASRLRGRRPGVGPNGQHWLQPVSETDPALGLISSLSLPTRVIAGLQDEDLRRDGGKGEDGCGPAGNDGTATGAGNADHGCKADALVELYVSVDDDDDALAPRNSSRRRSGTQGGGHHGGHNNNNNSSTLSPPSLVLGELPLMFVDSEGNTWHRSAERIGSGAASTVYRGLSDSGSLVALKCMQLRAHNIDIACITEEVRVFASLHHENIVQYIGVHVVQSYLIEIMEFVPGGSLDTLLSNFGPLARAAVRRYLRDILCGLNYLHSQSIVHCDVKPHNVLLAMDGQCKLSDFGSAMARAANSLASPLADTDNLRGTPAYIAPEVARGEVPTMKSDIFSLGVTILELLTGTLPWRYAADVCPATNNTFQSRSATPSSRRAAPSPFSAAIPAPPQAFHRGSAISSHGSPVSPTGPGRPAAAIGVGTALPLPSSSSSSRVGRTPRRRNSVVSQRVSSLGRATRQCVADVAQAREQAMEGPNRPRNFLEEDMRLLGSSVADYLRDQSSTSYEPDSDRGLNNEGGPFTDSPCPSAAQPQSHEETAEHELVAPTPQQLARKASARSLARLLRNPFSLIASIGKGEVVPYIPDYLDEDVVEFLMLCLNEDPDKRATAMELMTHRWLL